jgi:hypothetical protein
MQNNNGSIEGLILLIEKMRSDLEQSHIYLDKLKYDKTKMKHTLQYNQDNLRYLQVHCGVVAIDYVRTIRNQIKRLNTFLSHADADIKKFEESMDRSAKIIADKEEDLKAMDRKQKNTVIQFRRRKK